MRAFLMLITLLTVTNAFAATKSKDAACQEYFKAVQKHAPAEIQVKLVVNVLNDAFELNYDTQKLSKLNNHLLGILKMNPKKMDDFGGSAYFACMTDLTQEDKALAKQQFDAVVGN